MIKSILFNWATALILQFCYFSYIMTVDNALAIII